MNQVYFGTIKSYDDLGMILTDVEIGLPEPWRMLVEVPGRNGQLDLTSSLASDTRYKNRTISLTFAMVNYQHQWLNLFSAVTNAVHGKHLNVKIDPETDRYWSSFCTVNSLKCDRNKGTVVIDLDAYPYKLKDVSVSVTATAGGTSKQITVTEEPVIPEITCASSITITEDGTVYSFDAGTSKNTDFVLDAGTHTLLVKGSGSVTIAYKDGSL